MALFRFRWLHRFIRRHTNPISEERAQLWKRRLALGYTLVAWNAFGLVIYMIYTGKADWAAYHGLKSPEELAMSPGQQWAKTLGKNNATIYRLSGFELKKIETNENNTVEQSEDSELKN